MGRGVVTDEYPDAALRFELNLAFVPQADTVRLRQRWAAQYPADAQRASYTEDCPHVAAAFAALGLPLKPLETNQIANANQLANEVMGRRSLQGTYDDARVVVMAMRSVYDSSVEAGEISQAIRRAESLGPVLSASVKQETRDRRRSADREWMEASREAQDARNKSWKKLFRSELVKEDG
jgi:hypothetical protein